jgi:hypothetical protein
MGLSPFTRGSLAAVALAAVAAGCGLPSVTTTGGPADGGAGKRDAGAGSADASPHDSAAESSGVSDAHGAGEAGDAAGAEAEAGGAGGGHKRGIAYGNHSDADLAALAPGITWWYNWSPSPDSTLSTGYYAQVGVEFVPMIWGGTFDTTKLATQVPASAKFLLTFNEPNFGDQSNLTPQQAAALWPTVQAFAQSEGLKIVSPAVNYCSGNCNETDPYVWLSDFFSACQGCEVDYVAVHWYACTQDALTGYLQKFETEFNKPIWLTEFSCLDGSLAATVANEQSYVKEAIAALEADPMVFRYSWFTGRDTSADAIDLLGGGSGSLTALGQEYVAASPTK